MRLSTAASAIICCHAAATLNSSHAFVVSKSSIRRAGALSEGRESAVAAAMGQMEQVVDGPVVDLRGGKTTGSKKGKESSAKSKSSKASKSKKASKKPSFIATIKAFFQSLVNPHFALKLQAKKEQHNTVHGSGSA
ncbi:unnamed protein product [Ectocarpus sp. 8 AP-2014]